MEPQTSQPNSSLQKEEFCWEASKNGKGLGVRKTQAVGAACALLAVTM